MRAGKVVALQSNIAKASATSCNATLKQFIFYYMINTSKVVLSRYYSCRSRVKFYARKNSVIFLSGSFIFILICVCYVFIKNTFSSSTVLLSDKPIYNIPKEYEIISKWSKIKEYPEIPRIIHQIWIGDLEKAHCSWMDTFRIDFMKQNRGWTYKLWNREVYEQKYGPMILGEVYDIEDFFASKADVLRYEIIWR
jgi:hypothetical protein